MNNPAIHPDVLAELRYPEFAHAVPRPDLSNRRPDLDDTGHSIVAWRIAEHDGHDVFLAVELEPQIGKANIVVDGKSKENHTFDQSMMVHVYRHLYSLCAAVDPDAHAEHRRAAPIDYDRTLPLRIDLVLHCLDDAPCHQPIAAYAFADEDPVRYLIDFLPEEKLDRSRVMTIPGTDIGPLLNAFAAAIHASDIIATGFKNPELREVIFNHLPWIRVDDDGADENGAAGGNEESETR